ncbi:MAG TPA: pentapeptide repeat-containing protein [Prolixibacteraceae bacterium]|nr:pentapeptide repeat-containing protein [Prolixibacteraceae bacterium]
MKVLKISITIIFLGLLVYIAHLALLLNPPAWTGFGESVKDPKIEPAKTLFDWLKLLIIPLSLGLLGWSYKEAEKSKAKKSEEERSRNETLNSFFNVITDLLQNHNLAVQPNVQTKALAKTRINMALSLLDGARKEQVLQFLYESDLIDRNPKLKLLGANFNNSILDQIVLGNSEIRGAYFKNASLKNSNLNEIILNSSNLERANLSGSLVENADFGYTNLKKSILKNMDLTSVDFEGADLTKANLKGSTITQAQLDSIIHKNKIKLSKKRII